MTQDNIEKQYVVCVGIEEEHLADSVLVQCTLCLAMLWVSPHHIGKREPICFKCVEEQIRKEEDVVIGILQEDLKRALKAMKLLKEKQSKT